MKPIMLATDGSPTADEATKKAIELAKVVETELVIVTAWDIPYSTLGYAAIPLVTKGRSKDRPFSFSSTPQ